MMTLAEIHEYISGLLDNEELAKQEATLIIHCADGDLEVSKKQDIQPDRIER
jgi:hypothetical protein